MKKHVCRYRPLPQAGGYYNHVQFAILGRKVVVMQPGTRGVLIIVRKVRMHPAWLASQTPNAGDSSASSKLHPNINN